jgi:hypothetical protein
MILFNTGLSFVISFLLEGISIRQVSISFAEMAGSIWAVACSGRRAELVQPRLRAGCFPDSPDEVSGFYLADHCRFLASQNCRVEGVGGLLIEIVIRAIRRRGGRVVR